MDEQTPLAAWQENPDGTWTPTRAGAGPQGVQGVQGIQGIQGVDGPPGPAGPGVPTGGTAGQMLTKTSGVDYATGWTTPFGQADADARYVKKSGDTMTGDLTVVATGSRQVEVKSTDSAANVYVNGTTAANLRFAIGGSERFRFALGSDNVLQLWRWNGTSWSPNYMRFYSDGRLAFEAVLTNTGTAPNDGNAILKRSEGDTRWGVQVVQPISTALPDVNSVPDGTMIIRYT